VVGVTGVCPCCGTPYDSGDYRCDGEINGQRCGKDLVELNTSATANRSGWSL